MISHDRFAGKLAFQLREYAVSIVKRQWIVMTGQIKINKWIFPTEEPPAWMPAWIILQLLSSTQYYC